MTDNDKITEILNTNNVAIPASMLHILMQYIDSSVKRGGVVAEELITIGKCYETGRRILGELIQVKLLEQEKLNEAPPQQQIEQSVPQPVVSEKIKKIKKKQ